MKIIPNSGIFFADGKKLAQSHLVGNSIPVSILSIGNEKACSAEFIRYREILCQQYGVDANGKLFLLPKF